MSPLTNSMVLTFSQVAAVALVAAGSRLENMPFNYLHLYTQGAKLNTLHKVEK